jgi:uncharacterized membrane protein YeiH
MIYVLEHFAVAVNAIAGVLAARGRHIDLFGVVVLALVTAFGGGTIRDLCLGSTPVFWINDPNYAVTALIAATVTFFAARWAEPPRSFMEISDALGLAMFTIIGAQKSLMFGTGWLIAVALGTMTGVAGGIVRDVLLNELPLVFRKEIRLYATAAISGAVVYVVLKELRPNGVAAALTGSAVTLVVRLISIRWQIVLPVFRTRE